MRRLLLLATIVISAASVADAQVYTQILGRPTDHSITISIVFNQQVDLFVEYGLVSGNYTHRSDTISNSPNIADDLEIMGLLSDTLYYYRTSYRLSANGPFIATLERSFRTQRAIGKTFTFTIEADEHLYDKKGSKNLYRISLANQALDNPDFMISLGDIFGDDHYPFTITQGKVDSLHRAYLPLLGEVCHSIPLYICLGNHEGEFDYYLAQTPPNNLAVWATLSRKAYYPNPYPNTFYSGNTTVEPYGIGTPENYYAWTWGDALFVVLDAYRDQCDTSAKPKNWAWTLGYPQYQWLKNTLEGSNATYKFVFAHHVRGQGRGGVTNAHFFEWGGYEADGVTWGFTNKRPGWAKPIQKLFVDNGVTIFFQGHDHLFSREVLEGVTYQEVPMPSDSTYNLGMLANADAYLSDTIAGSGHLRVTVSPDCIKVAFIRAFLPADTLNGINKNREVAFEYQLGPCASTGTIEEPSDQESIRIFPNPADKMIKVVSAAGNSEFSLSLINTWGQIIRNAHGDSIDTSGLPNGIYIVSVESEEVRAVKKIVVNHAR